jgi:hypothetical protein
VGLSQAHSRQNLALPACRVVLMQKLMRHLKRDTRVVSSRLFKLTQIHSINR